MTATETKITTAIAGTRLFPRPPALRALPAVRRAADSKRASGFFAIARATTRSHAGESVGFSSEGASGSWRSTFWMMVVTDPVNGLSPVRSW